MLLIFLFSWTRTHARHHSRSLFLSFFDVSVQSSWNRWQMRTRRKSTKFRFIHERETKKENERKCHWKTSIRQRTMTSMGKNRCSNVVSDFFVWHFGVGNEWKAADCIASHRINKCTCYLQYHQSATMDFSTKCYGTSQNSWHE